MGMIENIINQTFASMSAAERRDLMNQVATKAMEKMTADDRTALVNTFLDNFLAQTDPAAKRELLESLVPRLVRELMHDSGLNLNELVALVMKGAS